ncbi:hypothetical protein EJ065_5697 [Corallococcus coralloides]|uniref:Uncharacterized protein n=1 Tax=Corallococcus coralloides TaxID=184914 RepID=A0A410RZE8_CORCK|nr:hypothetical protein EJ065_5697 [Corallococcus coralloides]
MKVLSLWQAVLFVHLSTTGVAEAAPPKTGAPKTVPAKADALSDPLI